MGWNHPDISLDNLLNLVKGFVDILILASGYQSSAIPAVWDAENIKKAVKWGVFFENVFRRIHDTDDYQESVKEFDEALLELKSNSYFPQGLAHLSSATLTKARDFVLEHLLRAIPLRDTHLSALLYATIQMDLDDLSRTECDCLDTYTEKMAIQIKSLDLMPGADTGIKDSSEVLGSPLSTSGSKTKERLSDDHSSFVVQELLKRQATVSHISSVEAGLDVLAEIVIKNNNWAEFRNKKSGDQSCSNISIVNEEDNMGFLLWNQWRSRNISYLLHKRTIRLISGASLIFSAPKVQWVQVLEQLRVSTKSNSDNLMEIIEISLLGVTSSRWTCVIEHFMSVACDRVPISKQYNEIREFLQDRSQFVHSKEHMANSEENDILEYVIKLLGTQLQLLWNLPAVLIAAAIPSWSTLFRLYLNEIDKEMKGDSSTVGYCTCNQEAKLHTDCEIAERIWCLYVFHVKRILSSDQDLQHLTSQERRAGIIWEDDGNIFHFNSPEIVDSVSKYIVEVLEPLPIIYASAHIPYARSNRKEPRGNKEPKLKRRF